MLSTSLDQQAGLLVIKRGALLRLTHACKGGFRRNNIPQSMMHYCSAERYCQMASEATARYVFVKAVCDVRKIGVVRSASTVLQHDVASQLRRYASLLSCSLSMHNNSALQ